MLPTQAVFGGKGVRIKRRDIVLPSVSHTPKHWSLHLDEFDHKNLDKFTH